MDTTDLIYNELIELRKDIKENEVRNNREHKDIRSLVLKNSFRGYLSDARNKLVAGGGGVSAIIFILIKLAVNA